jgi:hypothetical protein
MPSVAARRREAQVDQLHHRLEITRRGATVERLAVLARPDETLAALPASAFCSWIWSMLPRPLMLMSCAENAPDT